MASIFADDSKIHWPVINILYY